MGKHLKARKKQNKRPRFADASLISVRIADAVKITGISRTKLYSLINDGSIPSSKVGRATLLMVDDLRAYVNASQRTGIGKLD
ncbi:helix-turn-helix domain-containing protein [Sphingobium phenoxybenzoativorans]|uniref:helix-turn-helix domain-containing protein n=1 Tax=Sphingobium phenoxybenzoativorans TaxID=1592790 RepID=UPI0008723C05|nr:helix-turn-helix domain-containing protein [Sphingobium phenoxybenzoativorans]